MARALLGLRAREIHLCGGPEAIDVVERLCQATGDDLEVCACVCMHVQWTLGSGITEDSLL
jgi:hypothetical protein